MRRNARWFAAALLVLGVVAVHAASKPGQPGKSCDPRLALASCATLPASYECRWAQLIESRASAHMISELTGGDDATDPTAALTRLFPKLAGASLVEEAVARPPGLSYERSGFAPYALAEPIDWGADPYGNREWQFGLQRLDWVAHLAERSPAGMAAAEHVLVDWVERVLHGDLRLEFTWHDFGIAQRLIGVWQFMDSYIAAGRPLKRQVVHAVAAIVLSHLYALATAGCYNDRHNHGMMQDIALIQHATRSEALVDGDALAALAEERLLVQARVSVTDDGVHIENSPHYHLLFVELLTNLLAEVYGDGKRPPPSELVPTRDALFDALAQLLQPDHTFPEIGDTPNRYHGNTIRKLMRRANDSMPIASEVNARLQFVMTLGAEGAAPPLDRVFERGGYAVFRDNWWRDAHPAGPISAHFSCSRHTRAHYQSEETAFVLHAYGQALLVGPGRHANKRSDPFTAYSKSAPAHNVLIVDGTDWPTSFAKQPQIVDHHIGETLSWVRGTHDYYRGLGIREQLRVLAHAKPDTFIVVDSLHADRAHLYEQHFHLHPKLSEVTLPRPGAVLATSPEGGPTLALIAATPTDSIDVVRGNDESSGKQSWFFPSDTVVLPNADVVLRYKRPAGDVRLPMLLIAYPPGADVEGDLPTVETALRGDRLELRWQRSGERRVEVLPAGTPPAR